MANFLLSLLLLVTVGVIPTLGGATEGESTPLQIPIQSPVQIDVANVANAAAAAAAIIPRRNSRTNINSILAATQQTWAPLPDGAKPICKNCSTKGYDQIQLAPDVFAITEGQYWAMAVVSETRSNERGYYGAPTRTLAVVDAPPTITKFVDAIKELLVWTKASTVTDFILTHHHNDHIAGGAAVVAAWPKARVIAHETVKATLTDGRDLKGRPVPTVTFKTSYKLPTYGLQLDYPGTTHSVGNIVVWHPKSKVIMLVDVVFPKWVPFKNLAVSESIPGFIKGYEIALKYPFETIIAGHLSTYGNRADTLQGQEYVRDVMDNAAKALATVDGAKIAADLGTYDPTSPNYANWWLWFGQYLDACTDWCYDEVAKKWLGVIGAVDVFAWSHCDVAVESVRID